VLSTCTPITKSVFPLHSHPLSQENSQRPCLPRQGSSQSNAFSIYGPCGHLHFLLHLLMSASVGGYCRFSRSSLLGGKGLLFVILASPFLQGTKLVGVSSDPGLGSHVAAALRTPFGTLDKRRTRPAGVVALFPYLARYLSTSHGLGTRRQKASRHVLGTSLDGRFLQWNASAQRDFPVALLRPSRYRSRRINPCTFQLLSEVHTQSKTELVCLSTLGARLGSRGEHPAVNVTDGEC